MRASSIEDVLAAVGRGEMFSGDVVRAVYPDFKDERRAPRRGEPAAGSARQGRTRQGQVPRRRGASGIPIRGLDSDLPVRFAPDGGAVPGDRIVGILTPGEGVTIYPIQSPALAAFDNEPDRWLDVRWDSIRARRSASRPASSCNRSTSPDRSRRSPR